METHREIRCLGQRQDFKTTFLGHKAKNISHNSEQISTRTGHIEASLVIISSIIITAIILNK